MSQKDSEIIVIGGGPAGVMAAILLARAGLGCTLIEQQRFPRDKVCGECLSALGIATLRRTGLAPLIERLGPAELCRTTLIGPEGTSATHDLTLPIWGVTRRAMDAALIEAAAAAGANVLQPARAEKLECGSDRSRVTLRNGTDLQTLDADHVIVADGKGALGSQKPQPTGDLGIKAHFRDVEADAHAIHLFALAGHYGGLAAVEDGLWNVALSIPEALAKAHRGNLEALWEEIVAGNAFLRRAFRHSHRVTKFLASPLPRFAVRQRWTPGVIPVGNAAAALEPIGGEGMGLALRSAELAAEAIIAAKRKKREVDIIALRTSYARLWRVRRAACRTAAVAMSWPGLSGPMIDLSATSEGLTRAVMSLMGKAQD